jgi:hypothetical protein
MHACKADIERMPNDLRPLFWDCDFASLQWPADRDFIMTRILVSGEWDAVLWLRKAAGDAAVEEWLKGRKGGGLSPERLRFWELVLDIPHRTVSSWIMKEGPSIWRQRVAQ